MKVLRVIPFVLILLMWFIIGWVILTQTADAHRIPEGDAESRWYYVFNSHCGNGTTNVCLDRNIYLDCNPASGRIHAYWCSYQFKEGRPSWIPGVLSTRYCTVSGYLIHTTVDTWQENCTGWT